MDHSKLNMSPSLFDLEAMAAGIKGAPSDGLPAAPETCPVCGLMFDPRDLAQVMRHLHPDAQT